METGDSGAAASQSALGCKDILLRCNTVCQASSLLYSMPNSLADDLQRPLRKVEHLLAGCNDQPDSVHSRVDSYFGGIFGTLENMAQVPVLTQATADGLRLNSLVRFRGMVVDMFNPEFFLGAFRTPDSVWKPAALYTDSVPDDDEIAGVETRIMERRPLLINPVPHEQQWATAMWSGCPVEPSTPRASDRTKRARESSEELAAAAAADSSPASSDGSEGPVNKAAKVEADTDTQQQNGDREPELQDIVEQQQQQRPGFGPGDCIVQVYGDADKFQLHDVVEVVGVYSTVPELAGLQLQGHDHDHANRCRHDEEQDAFWQERTAALPPTSQVLRVHALTARKLSPYPKHRPALSNLAADIPVLRQKAIELLAAPLAGDELAAEYVLLASLATVVARDGGSAVGLVPINITNCPSSSTGAQAFKFIRGLAAALGTLLPHVALLPLTVSALNSKRWWPEQCSVTGRLHRGLLQNAQGTLLLCDETDMRAGELTDVGVKNLQALNQVIVRQQLPCGCQVYTHTLHVNQPAIVLSTERSILRDSLTLQLPISPRSPVLAKPADNTGDTGAGSAAASQASKATATGTAQADWQAVKVAGPEGVAAAAAAVPELEAVRDYLAAVRSIQCKMDQTAAEQCVARFRAQQQANSNLGMEDLNNIITLSKLLSISQGLDTFTLDSWDRVVQLEQLRKQRVVAAHPQRQQ